MSQNQGPISENDLKRKLVNAKKVMNKQQTQFIDHLEFHLFKKLMNLNYPMLSKKQ